LTTRLFSCSSEASSQTDERGQTIIEFALVVPLVLLLCLGLAELGFALADQQVVTKLTREGSNLISRDSTLQDAANAMKGMSSRPVDFTNGSSKLIFSVLKRGATTGTANFDQVILYQRYEYGSLPNQSFLQTAGSASFAGPPNYEGNNSDNNTNLRVTNVPANIVSVIGGMIYITEIYSTHPQITPLANMFGVSVPTTLYSIAYF